MVLSTAFATNPEHTITIKPHDGRVVVIFKGTVVADTVKALRLKEASYPETFYVPFVDCKTEHFTSTSHASKCPFKGTASYWSLSTKDGEVANAVWGYGDPFDQVAAIAGHVAFCPDGVDIRAGGG